MAREYNHLAFSEDMALGHGVDVARVQRLTFVGAGLDDRRVRGRRRPDRRSSA